jgi:RHS repeat-associated protein
MVTDRKGQVSSYTYDGIGRGSTAAFGVQSGSGGTTNQSSISYTYDGGNRLLQAVDSASGTVTRTFDLFDRLTNEATPQGSIAYSYDSAGRRTTMQVAGQSQVAYTWDNTNRLAGITQGTNSVGFTYDNANRRSSLTLPNGIVASYSYDQGSRLTGISYGLGGNSVGNLSYTYDSLGRRISMGGALATLNLPQPLASATYDAANELSNWNGVGISYDANGSMVSDSVHTYSWDARNQLASIDSGGAASFSYDTFGRRTSKTITGVATIGFLYDGANSVQELNGSSPIASLLTGSIDEHLARTDSTGQYSFLTDVLGSTVALTDATGTVQTQYAYDPFGGTTQSGASTINSFAYTGRELDTAGLYFLRARYYSPAMGRFISEDPIGLAGGNNEYAYVADEPTDFLDPFGLDKKAPNNPAPKNGWDWDEKPHWPTPPATPAQPFTDCFNGAMKQSAPPGKNTVTVLTTLTGLLNVISPNPVTKTVNATNALFNLSRITAAALVCSGGDAYFEP